MKSRHLRQDDPVLQDRLPDTPWADPGAARLPGIRPLDPALWLIRDEAFAPQMVLRDRLIADRRDEVHALLPDAHDAALECLDHALTTLASDAGYRVESTVATRPDGVRVLLDRTQPLITLGRLTQADICLLQPGPDGHVLTGAILCFPAHWTLADKIGRPLVPIHAPVPEYDGDIARRVQRLFDAIRPGQALWRANAHACRLPDLFTPKREADRHHRCPLDEASYLRSERQVLIRLPKTRAVVFAIHTRMVALGDLTEEQIRGFEARASA